MDERLESRDQLLAIRLPPVVGEFVRLTLHQRPEVCRQIRLGRKLRAADERSGAYSILTGVAANQSIATGQPVKIADLVKNIGVPTYPKMTSGGPLPMPQKA